ncbi:MAG: hypothetical protein C4589_09515 [Peptococcaceae bacterium]|nr:MAG: hypothetical protein C4589_09515 [Peptococcaceae bacterium]
MFLETLETGLDLLVEFAFAQFRPAEEIPDGLSYDGWTVIPFPGPTKYSGSVYALKGHGLKFLFPISTPAESLWPPVENLLAWCKITGESPAKTWKENPVHAYRQGLQIFHAFLERCRQEYEAGGGENLLYDRLTAFIVKAFTTGYSKEERQTWIKQAGLNPDWRVGEQKRLNRLKEYQGQIGEAIRQLITRAYPTGKELKSKRLYPAGAPVIYLKPFFHPEPQRRYEILARNYAEMLAQMCIFAYRQHKAQDCVSYLREYVKAVLHKKDNLDVVSYLLEKWEAPPGRESFDAYISKCAKFLKKADYKPSKEILLADIEKARPKIYAPLSFPITVQEAAELMLGQGRIPDKPENVVRWLYRRLEEGRIENAGTSFEKLTPEGIRSPKNTYLLSKEGFEEAKRLWEFTKAKADLARDLKNKKRITPRAARKWIESRLDKGQTLKEIWGEYNKQTTQV